jgi:hypothetical protein
MCGVAWPGGAAGTDSFTVPPLNTSEWFLERFVLSPFDRCMPFYKLTIRESSWIKRAYAEKSHLQAQTVILASLEGTVHLGGLGDQVCGGSSGKAHYKSIPHIH